MGKRRTITIIGASALALGVAALIAWPIAAASQRDSVVVYPDARAYLCETGQVSFEGDDDEQDPSYTQSVAATKDMDCELRFHIQNNSPAAIELTSATYELGPSLKWSATVDRIDGQPAVPIDDGYSVQRTMSVPVPIGPGEDYLLVSHLTFNANGCMGEDTWMTDDGPTVTISALGLSGQRTPGFGSFTVGGSPDSSEGCDAIQ